MAWSVLVLASNTVSFDEPPGRAAGPTDIIVRTSRASTANGRAEPAAAKGRTDLFESVCFDIVELRTVGFGRRDPPDAGNTPAAVGRLSSRSSPAGLRRGPRW